VNTISSAAKVIEHGAILRRVIPAACWGIATIIWVASYLFKNQ
jgi:hypothetical protein